MKKRTLILILLVIVLMLALSACSKPTNIGFLDKLLIKAGLLSAGDGGGGSTLDEGVRVISATLKADWISECVIGAQIKLSGGKLSIAYSNDSVTEIALTQSMLSGVMSTSMGNVAVTGAHLVDGLKTENAGTLTIIVTYGEIKAYHRVSVKSPVNAADISIKNIMVTPGSIKRVLYIGDEFDFDNAKLTVDYYDGSTRNIPITASMLSGFTTAAEGDFSLTVTYFDFKVDYGYSVQKEALDINKDTVLYVSVKDATLKNVYNVGESLDVTGGILIVTDSYYAESELPILAEYISGFSSEAAGEVVLTLTYMEKTCEYTVNILSGGASVHAIPLYTANELYSIRDNLSGNYYLANNIDLGTLTDKNGNPTAWLPIGSSAAPFSGVLDGKGFAVTNLKINSYCNGGLIGLFGVNAGTVLDLEVKNAAINIHSSAGMSIGALVGVNKGTLSSNAATPYDTKSSGQITVTFSNSSSQNIYVGGIAGVNEENASVLAVSSVSVAVYGNSKIVEAGGLIGRNSGKVLSGSHASGDVYALAAGGLTGKNSGMIDQSYASGNISGVYAGGIAGENSGTLTGTNSVGTVAADFAGGLIGKNYSGTVRRSCYSSAVVSGTVYAGGLIAESQSSEISDCYSEAEVTGATVGGILGYSYKDVIMNCILNVPVGAVNSGGNAIAGGIAGKILLSYLYGCSSNGAVSADGKISMAGGLVGYNAGEIGSKSGAHVVEDSGKCVVNANVSATAAETAYAGGLSGKNFGYITNSFLKSGATVKASAPYAYAGGIVGLNSKGGTVIYVTGVISVTAAAKSENVTPYAYAGGIAGAVNGGTVTNCNSLSAVSASAVKGKAYAGGITGGASLEEETPNISAVYFSGTVSSAAQSVKKGGISGQNAGVFTNCYYNVDKAGNIGAVEGADIPGTPANGSVPARDGAMGKKAPQMLDTGDGIKLKGFDNAEIWSVKEKENGASFDVYYLPMFVSFGLNADLYKIEICTVTFSDSETGTVSAALVAKGKFTSAYPAVKEGYRLVSWKKDNREFNFSAETVQENITLVAFWEEIE